MIIPVTFFIALAAYIVAYALGQGGPVGALIFLLIIFVGAALQYSKPLIDRIRP